jgi:hypothetical protein
MRAADETSDGRGDRAPERDHRERLPSKRVLGRCWNTDPVVHSGPCVWEERRCFNVADCTSVNNECCHAPVLV